MNEIGPQPTAARRAARAAQRRRQVRARRTWVAVLGGLALLLLATLVAWSAVRPLVARFTESGDYPGPGSGEVRVVVAAGASGTAIGEELAGAGVVKTVDAFIKAAAADPRADGIQPGEYLLRQEMSAAGALAVLVDPTNRQVATVTIKEGLRLADIITAVSEQTTLSAEDLKAAASAPADLGLPAEAGGTLEGWLFPATYEVSNATTATQLLQEMIQRMITELTDLSVARADWERTVTFASLVQAESGSQADAPKVARVLENRLDRDWPLQLDATVNYALDRYKVAVSLRDLEVDSPYNTYRNTGLPPGPICSPGRVSLQAALNPEPGDWLYFVTVNPDTGETKYARTEPEFFQLKAELDRWLAANPGR